MTEHEETELVLTWKLHHYAALTELEGTMCVYWKRNVTINLVYL